MGILKRESVSRHKYDLLVILLLLLLPFLINFNVFFSISVFPKIFPYRNDFLHTYNYLSLTTDIVRNQESCLWYPSRGFGMPYLGFPVSGMLYPPTIILSLFNDHQNGLPFTNFILYLFMAKAAAAILFYFVMRNLEINRWGALVGSIVWGFNLRFDDSVRLEPGSVHTFIWLPLIFLVTYRLLSKSEKRNIAFFALLFGLMYFANYAVNFLPAMLFIGLFAILSPFDNLRDFEPKIYARGTAGFLAAAALGVSLIAVQFLPNLEYADNWVRGGYSFLDTMIYRCTPSQFLYGYIFPEVASTEKDHYVGIIPILLVVLGMALPDKRYRFKKFLLFVIVLTSVYAMRSFISTPLQRFLYDYVPPFNQLRCPGRFLILHVFCLSILAGYGMDAITTSSVSRKSILKISAISFICLLIVSVTGYFVPGVKSIILDNPNPYDAPFLVLLSILILLLFIRLDDQRRKNFVSVIIIAVIIVDLVYVTYRKNDPSDETHISYYLAEDPGIVDTKSLVTNSINERLVVLPPEEQERLGLSYLNINYPFLFFNSIVPGVSHCSKFGYQWGLSDPNYFFVKTIDSRRVRSLLNTRIDVEYFLPRAFIVYNVEKLERKEMLQRMLAPDFDPLNTHFIEDDLPDSIKKTLAEQPYLAPEETERLQQIKEQTEILSYGNDRVEIRTRAPRPGFLFVSDFMFPGWKAYLDGKPVKMYRTNYLFRGLPVPEGEHTVRFLYRPRPVIIGLLISLSAVAVIFFLFVRERKSIAAWVFLGCVGLFYGPLLLPHRDGNRQQPVEPITPYEIASADGLTATIQRRTSNSLIWEMRVDQDGAYDLVITNPPKAYALYIDNEFATKIYNMGDDGPIPEPGVWEVQTTLRLSEGLHNFTIMPIMPDCSDSELRQFHLVFREKLLPQKRDVNEELYRMYNIKLVKH